MKLEIEKSKLKNKLEVISKALTNNSHLPALEGILMTVNSTTIELLASDGNLSIKEVMNVEEGIKVEEVGKVLVPGKLFREVISKQGSVVSLESDENTMVIKSEKTKTKLNLFSIEEYPTISFDTFGKDLVIDANDLKEIIKNVSFAAANEDRRIILNGVNLKAREGKLTANATNSFRLAREVKDIDSSIEFDITILSKKLKDFLPASAKGEIIINVDDSKIISKIGTATISSRLIDGVYLPVEKLLVSEFSSKLQIETKELTKNIDRVSVMNDGGKRILKLIVDNENLIVESESSEAGSSKSETKNFSYEGDSIEIALNSGFFKEAVSKFDGKIIIGFNGSNKPILIKGESNKNLTQLVLPHRTF